MLGYKALAHIDAEGFNAALRGAQLYEGCMGLKRNMISSAICAALTVCRRDLTKGLAVNAYRTRGHEHGAFSFRLSLATFPG